MGGFRKAKTLPTLPEFTGEAEQLRRIVFFLSLTRCHLSSASAKLTVDEIL